MINTYNTHGGHDVRNIQNFCLWNVRQCTYKQNDILTGYQSGCEALDWIQMAQDTIQCEDLQTQWGKNSVPMTEWEFLSTAHEDPAPWGSHLVVQKQTLLRTGVGRNCYSTCVQPTTLATCYVKPVCNALWKIGHNMVWAVSSRRLMMEVRVQHQASPCSSYNRSSGSGTVFFITGLQFSPVSIIPPKPHTHSFICHWQHIPYILEPNPHPFYSFRGLKNQMRIRIACRLDSRSRAGFWKNDRAAVRAVRTIQ